MEPRTQTSALLEPLPVPVDQLHRMSPDVYESMIAHDLIRKDDKVVLLDGVLVKKNASSSNSPDRFYRMTTDLYHEMADHGLLRPQDKIELLNGLLVKKMPRGAPHVTITQRLVDALNDLAVKGWYVRKEDPITLPEGPDGGGSEPEPDVVVTRGGRDDYEDHHPGPEEVALVVEVADSSLREDREALPIYAWSGIPVVWIVNKKEKLIEVHSNPTGSVHTARFQEVVTFTDADDIPVVIDGREVGRISVKSIVR